MGELITKVYANAKKYHSNNSELVLLVPNALAYKGRFVNYIKKCFTVYTCIVKPLTAVIFVVS